MKKLALLIAVVLLAGCGAKQDRLTPYLQSIKPLEKYHKTMMQYREYLQAEETQEKAYDLKQVLENYKADLEKMGEIGDKKVESQHNFLIRKLDGALRRLGDPEDNTIPGQFILDARKRITDIEEAIKEHYYPTLEGLWEDAGKTEPFPLKWPE